MFASGTVLIVEEGGYAAVDLSAAIEESEGCVAGPVSTLSETLTVLDSTNVCGAVVDCELADACEVVMLLVQRDVPVVIQISTPLPRSLGDLGDQASILVRPVDSRTVLNCLLVQIGRSEMRAPNTLGSKPKQV